MTDFRHGHKTAFKTMNRIYDLKNDPILKGFAAHMLTVSADADDMRNEALYPDEESGDLPEQRWTKDDCAEFRDKTFAFFQAVRLRVT